MEPIPDSAAADAIELVDLLRRAERLTERLESETSGAPYEQVGMIERDLRRTRRQAERLRLEVERIASGGRLERRASAVQKPS